MAGDEAAFFTFGTNAEETASRIASSMQRIQQAMQTPLSGSGDTERDIGGLGQLFSRAEGDMRVAQERIRKLLNDPILDRDKFKTQYRKIVRDTIGAIPTMMADELALAPTDVAARTNAIDIAKGIGEDYIRTFDKTLKEGGGRLRTTAGQIFARPRAVEFAPDLTNLTLRPVDYANITKRSSAIVELRNRVRAEAMVKADMIGTSQEAKDREGRLGIREMTQSIREQQVIRIPATEKTDEKFVFTPSNAARELTELEAAQRAAVTASNNLQRAREGETKASLEAAAAARVLYEAEKGFIGPKSDYRRVGKTGLVDAAGRTSTLSPAGYRETTNVVRADDIRAAAAKQSAESANEQRLYANRDLVQQIGNYRLLNGEVYKLTNLGARRIELGYEEYEILKAQKNTTEGIARAEEMVARAEEFQRVGSTRALDSQGRALRVNATGVALETNPLRAQDTVDAAAKQREQVANGIRLFQNADSVQKVGTYRVLNDEVYKLTELGARRITLDFEELEVLKTQQAMLERQARTAQRLTDAESRRAANSARSSTPGVGGGIAGFYDRFTRGEQSIGHSLGGQVASAASFSLSYGALFGLQNAIRDTISEFMDYQDSMTDLQVATRNSDTVTGDWVDSLSELSRTSGSNVGAALDTAARGVRAFSSAEASANSKRTTGTAVEDAANKLALIANKTLQDATGDIISVGSSYDLKPDQLIQIVDAVTSAKRNLGGDPAQIAQGLSLIAGAAKEAGYDLNEAAAVISLVQSRTDQSGQAVATRLTRIFQIVGGSTGKRLASEFNVDPDSSVKDQITAYARKFTDPNISEGRKDRITSLLGGTANLKELLPLLKEGSALQKAFADAIKNSGSAASEFGNKTNNLPGILKKLSGDIKNIQVDLGRAGLFSSLGLAVKVIEPAVHAIDTFIKAYDRLGSALEKTTGAKWIQEVVGAVAGLAVAAKIIGTVQSVGAARKAEKIAEGTSRLAAEETFTTSLVTAMTERIAAEQAMTGAVVVGTEERAAAETLSAAETAAGGAAGGVVAGAASAAGKDAASAAEGAAAATAVRGGIRGGLATMARFLKKPTTLVGLGLTTGLFAFDKINTESNAESALRKQGFKDQQDFSSINGSSESIANFIKDLNAKRGTIKNTPVPFYGNDRKKERSELLAEYASEIAAAKAIQKKVEAEELATASTEGITQALKVFGSGVINTTQQLSDGADKMDLAGASQLDQVAAYRKAIETPPVKGGRLFSPEGLAADISGAVFGSLTDSIPTDAQGLPLAGSPGSKTGIVTTGEAQANRGKGTGRINLRDLSSTEIKKYLGLDGDGLTKIDKAVKDELDKMHLSGKQPLTDAQQQRLVEAAMGAADFSNLPEDARKVKEKWLKNSLDVLSGRSGVKVAKGGALNSPVRSKAQVLDILRDTTNEDGSVQQGYLSRRQASLAVIPADDDGTIKRAESAANVAFLRGLKRSVPGGKLGSFFNTELRNAEHENAVNIISRLEDLRTAAESRAKTTGELRRIRTSFAKREARRAGSDIPLLTAMFELLGKRQQKEVLDYINAYAATERAIYNAMLAVQAARQVIDAALGGDGSVTIDPKLGDAKDSADKADKAVRNANKALKGSSVSTDPAAGGGAGTVNDKGSKGTEKTAAQKAAERQAALIDPDNTVGAARAALRVAQANRAAAKTYEEKTAAIAEVNQAQDALDKAIAAGAGVAAQIAAARSGGGGIATAHAALVAATGALRGITPGTRAYAEALPAFYDAQWQMRNALVEYKNNLDLLRGDSTDPVEQARDAARAARRKLRSDRGAGKDIKAADRVAVQDTQNALAAARFSQRLSDMQTAEDLGRISFSKYMNYLDHEHDRLSRIKNRTHQQQEQLDQVDQAMKSALSSMDSQFNLGDINTRGLVYQVRRFKAEAQAERAASSLYNSGGRHDVSQTTVHINVNGADIVKVRRVIDDYLGIHGAQRRTLTRRKG